MFIFASTGRGASCQAEQALRPAAQEPVRVVLEHEQLALLGDPHQALAPRKRHRHAGGILEGGHRVHELRASPVGLEAIQRGLHLVHAHAVPVHLHLGEGLAIGSAYAIGALALGAFLVVG